jgi:hypothetical protein
MDKLNELLKIKEMLDSGIISENEFQELKNNLFLDSVNDIKKVNNDTSKINQEETNPNKIENLEFNEKIKINTEVENDTESNLIIEEEHFEKKDILNKKNKVIGFILFFLCLIIGIFLYKNFGVITNTNSNQLILKETDKHKNYVIDSTMTIDGYISKVTVEKKEDKRNKINATEESDVSNSTNKNSIHYSNEYIVSFEDKNDKSKASINLDLISKLIKSSKLQGEIGNLKEQILDDRITFNGISQNKFLIFKVFTSDGGEGGGEWTIGVTKDKKTTINNSSCVLMAYDRVVGEDFHYKNNEFYIGQFLGSWSADCAGMAFIEFDKKNDFVALGINVNQIYLNANFSVDESNPNKLMLYLKSTEDVNFGDLGVGGNNLPWNDYSKVKAIAEILFNPLRKDELEVNWLGFYNTKTNSYEWSTNPEFMAEGNNLIKKCSK